MSLVSTPAIVLAAVRYGETSKIVKLATRDLGVQSAIAKGALRPRSRYGAALQVMSDGVAQLYTKDGRDLQTLGAFDILHVRSGLARHMGRYAAASVLAEIMLRFGQPEAQPGTYDLFRDALNALEASPEDDVETLGLRAVWLLIGAMGFAPALEACAVDFQPLPADQPVAFSPRDGGVLCPGCARDRAAPQLSPGDRADLGQLLDQDQPLPALDARHAAAHRRLLARFARAHLSDQAAMPALDFWLARPWVAA
jgi:DNA repair protein RecO (recombination protein O)